MLDVTHKMRGDSSTIALTELEALIADFEKDALTENLTLLHKQFTILNSYHTFFSNMDRIINLITDKARWYYASVQEGLARK